MNSNKRFWRVLMGMAVALAALGATGVARAEGEPVIVVAGESEAGAPETTESVTTVYPNDYYLFLSAPGSGSVAGIAYADEDVLRYDPAGSGAWIKVFDGTNAGLPASADIDALAYTAQALGASYYMSFDAPTAVPGLGTVDDSDIVVYTTQILQTPVWSLFFDGSAHGLTTAGEDIDALELVVGTIEFTISTAGSMTVPGYYTATLTAADEDVVRVQNNGGHYLMELDGSLMGMTAANDVRGHAYIYTGNEDVDWLTMQRAATLTSNHGNLTVAANDIVARLDNPYTGVSYSLFFDASAAGFPKVDAMDVVRK